jgi:DNA-binding transcriptional MerR regulator
VTEDPDDPAEVLLTTEQAAAAAHVKPALIRRWRARNLLQPVNPDEPHPRYRELDVLTVEAMTRRQKREVQLAAEAQEWASREST